LLPVAFGALVPVLLRPNHEDATIAAAPKICGFPVKFPVFREIDPSENAG
jgi:hypothetical protein